MPSGAAFIAAGLSSGPPLATNRGQPVGFTGASVRPSRAHRQAGYDESASAHAVLAAPWSAITASSQRAWWSERAAAPSSPGDCNAR